MTIPKTLSASKAADLDKELMSEEGGFSIDQLMELAGLSVSQAAYAMQPPTKENNRVLVACGPGNNGGDGLVAARHLYHYGYDISVYYPKQPKNELYERLVVQLSNLQIPILSSFPRSTKEYLLIIDAIFGFSFHGAVREPFHRVISMLETSSTPVLAVDAPSSWNIDDGPPFEGPGSSYYPDALISLTAPKPLVRFYNKEEERKKGKGRHFVGGRFLSRDVAERFEVDVPEYKGAEQIVEVELEDVGEMWAAGEKL